ncbi:hypothetical protein cd221108_2563 [Clostridioides difficile]
MKNIMQKEILAKSYNLRTNQQEQTLVEHIKDLFEVLEFYIRTKSIFR